MTTTPLIVTRDQHVATISLNRPEKRNALNGDLMMALADALPILAEDEAVRAVLIQGKGPAFCAGGDLNWMQTMAASTYHDNYRDAGLLAELLYELYYFPKPTIALAHGVILGGGIGLLCCCDIVLAGRGAQFGFAEVKLGIAPSTISPYVMEAIGPRMANYYFLTGQRFDAETAASIGIAHQVIDDDKLLDAGNTLVAQLLDNGPQALQIAKKLVRDLHGSKITPALGEQTAAHLAELRTSPEAKEGLAAFCEKRKPNWR